VSAVVRDPSLQTHRRSGSGMQDAADLADPLVDVRDVVESFRCSHLTLPDRDEICACRRKAWATVQGRRLSRWASCLLVD
jgi:hypothetical protein